MAYIQRLILPELLRHLNLPEITLIVGPRQAGKTTLMQQMEREAAKQGRPTRFLSFDKEQDRQQLDSQTTLVEALRHAFGPRPGILFLDEVQQKEDAGRWLKGIYDMQLPYKMVVTGSGSLELKAKIHESLAGRKRLFEVLPLSFEEFAQWKTEYAYQMDYLRLAGALDTQHHLARSLLDEYLAFGGYPRVVLAQTTEEKQAILEDIYSSFLIKDMRHLLEVRKLDDLRHLVRILADQTGQLLSVASLSRDVDASQATLANYLWYLEETFIIRRITPFSARARQAVRRSPVAYFIDPGLRNSVLGRARLPLSRQDHNWLFQTLVGNILHSVARASDHVHFWRTKTGSEIDFVVERGTEIIPIEVKDTAVKEPKLPRAYQAFLQRYQPRHGVVVNTQLEEVVRYHSTDVQFVPWWKLQGALSLNS